MRLQVLVVALVVLAACDGSNGNGGNATETTGNLMIELPPPAATGEVSLNQTLATRRSRRDFLDRPLDHEELSQLLWATQGVTSASGQRTAPSAGGLYPLEVYLVTASGHYHYHPDCHQLELVAGDDVRADLAEAAMAQQAVQQAPATFVITAVYARTEAKYGDRAERYVKLEVGHAAQNLLLQAVALRLGAVPIGAFSDDRVADLLDLPDDHEPLYLIPVGQPAADSG